MTLAEKLTEVANNRPKLYKKGALDYSPQETVSGESISITDISPIEHNMAVSVRSKSMVNIPDFTFSTSAYHKTLNIDMFKGKTITLSALLDATNSETQQFNLRLDYTVNGVVTYNATQRLKSGEKAIVTVTVAVPENATLLQFVRQVVSSNNVGEATVSNIQIEEGTTATSYAPYIEDISTVKLYKQGKNLIPYPYANKTQTKNGITFNVNEDGTIIANGTATALTQFNLYVGENLLLPNVNYTISGCSGGSNATYDLRVTDNKTQAYACFSSPISFSYADMSSFTVSIKVSSGVTLNNVVFKPQISIGTTPTEYEPYIEPTVYDVQADGTVEGVKSLYPNTTLYTDTSGAVIDCTYYQDGKKVKENLTDMILSLGGVINE